MNLSGPECRFYYGIGLRGIDMKQALVALSFVLAASLARAQVTDRVSVSSGGTQGDALSARPRASTTGQFVVFQSNATNLVAGDTNAATDVFVRDRTAGTTTRVSVITGGGQANGASTEPSISADGRYVTFTSAATNLVAGDTNLVNDVFLHDRTTGVTTRISVDAVGAQANGASGESFITADATQVAFTSAASNLVAGDANGVADIFLKTLATGAIVRASVSSAGVEANAASRNPTTTSSGLFVVFTSDATNLVAGDGNAAADVFMRSIVGSATARVSVDAGGADSDGPSENAWVSSDGTVIAFESDATDLVAGDANAARDVFARNTVASTTALVSVDTAGAQGNGASVNGSPSSGGRYVSFTSSATNLVTGDLNGAADVFVRDTLAGRTRRASLSSTSVEANGASSVSAMTPDGLGVMFDAVATNLAAGDTNAVQDVFAAPNPTVPPTAGTVNDGTGADIDVQTVGTAVSANWTGFTAGSGAIASYEWAYGTTAGGTDLQGYVNVGASTSASNTTTLPSAGSSVFVSVRAIDANGNTSAVAVSDGVLIQASADAEISGEKAGKCGISAAPFGGASAPAAAAAILVIALAAARLRR